MKPELSLLVLIALSAAPAGFAGERRDPASARNAPSASPQATVATIEDDRESVLPVALARPNTVSIELLGRGGLYSLSYDRSLNGNISLGAGLSYLGGGVFGHETAFFMVPIYANFYFSPNSSRGFATAGADIAIVTGGSSTHQEYSIGTDGTINPVQVGDSKSQTGVGAVVGFGYEYRGTEGFLFRAAPYLLVAGGSVFPWIGLSAGTAF